MEKYILSIQSDEHGRQAFKIIKEIFVSVLPSIKIDFSHITLTSYIFNSH